MNSLGYSGKEEAVIYAFDVDAVVTSRGGPNTSRFRMIVIHNVACCLELSSMLHSAIILWIIPGCVSNTHCCHALCDVENVEKL